MYEAAYQFVSEHEPKDLGLGARRKYRSGDTLKAAEFKMLLEKLSEAESQVATRAGEAPSLDEICKTLVEEYVYITTVERDGMVKAQNLMELLANGDTFLTPLKEDPHNTETLMFMGITGQGKSTSVNMLLGTKLEKYRDPKQNNAIMVKLKEEKMRNVANTGQQQKEERKARNKKHPVEFAEAAIKDHLDITLQQSMKLQETMKEMPVVYDWLVERVWEKLLKNMKTIFTEENQRVSFVGWRLRYAEDDYHVSQHLILSPYLDGLLVIENKLGGRRFLRLVSNRASIGDIIRETVEEVLEERE